MSSDYPPPTPAYPYPQPPKKGMSKWLIALIVAGVLVLGCCGLGVVGLLVGAGEDADDPAESSQAASSEPTSEPAEPETTSEPANPETEAAPPGDDRIFPGSDPQRPLSFYREQAKVTNSPTFPWRVNVVDNQKELEAALRDVGFDDTMTQFDDSIWGYVLNTCLRTDQNGGEPPMDYVALEWSANLEPIAEDKAEAIYDVVTEYACPEFAN